MFKPFKEPDLFPHIGNRQNTLITSRIDIEGITNQRVVLTVPVTKLHYFDDYTLVIRQPIPSQAQGLPLFIKAVEDRSFVPDVSCGFGYKGEEMGATFRKHLYAAQFGFLNETDALSSTDVYNKDFCAGLLSEEQRALNSFHFGESRMGSIIS